ncbi:MAG: hypothetical protein PHD76_00890 [Methylacidiphilales bacterium]|nr:hypothetical protein [Candidatus Methylacidiphilales bacterium]
MSRAWRVILILGGLMLLSLFAAAAVLYWQAAQYLRSESFLKLVSQATANALQVRGEFSPIQWTGTSAYADSFTAKGLPGGAIKSLKAYQIRTELDWFDLIFGKWHLTTIEIRSAELQLQDSPASTNPAAPAAATTEPGLEGAASLSSAGSRKPVLIDKILIQNARVLWPIAPAPGSGLISDTRITLTSEGKSWLVTLAGGKVQQAGFPEFTLREGSLRCHQDIIYILNTVLLHPDHGQIAITGEARLQPTRQLQLDFDVQKIPVTSLLSGDWRARLTGDLSGTIHLRDPDGTTPASRLYGSIQLEDGRLEALPALDQLAEVTGTRDFKSLRLHTARTDFEKSGANLSFSGIKIESESLLRLEGRLDITGGTLNGLLDAGTVPSALQLLPGAADKVFTRKADGYIWAVPAVAITGTQDQPVEDLSPRIKQAAIEKITEKAGDVINSALDWLKPYIK